MIFLVTVLPFFAPFQPSVSSLTETLQRPNANHFLGTDGNGRDIFVSQLYKITDDVVGRLAVIDRDAIDRFLELIVEDDGRNAAGDRFFDDVGVVVDVAEDDPVDIPAVQEGRVQPAAMVETVDNMNEDVDLKTAGGETRPLDDLPGIKGVEDVLKGGDDEDKSLFSFSETDHGHLAVVLLFDQLPDFFDRGGFQLADAFPGHPQHLGNVG